MKRSRYELHTNPGLLSDGLEFSGAVARPPKACDPNRVVKSTEGSRRAASEGSQSSASGVG